MKREIDYVVCIPIYKVTERVFNCLESMGDVKDHILLVDNTGKRDCSDFLKEAKVNDVSFQQENIGVPRSWNIGLRKDHEWTFVVSGSMVFPDGFQPIVDRLRNHDSLMFKTNHGWHCAAVHKDAVNEIGYFDENFYPGYLEDCDWDRRFELSPRKKIPFVNIPAHCQQDGAATVDGCQVNIAPLRRYFVRKWGGVEGEGVYVHPFNDERNGLDFWVPRPITDLKREYGLR